MEIEQRLKGTRKRAVFQELFMNSIHFPLANVFLELLIEGPRNYIREPDFYTIMVACLVQAYFLGTWQYQGKSRRFLGNLIAPAIYTVIEGLIEGARFFTAPHHLAYWGFALSIGLLQEINKKPSSYLSDVLTVLEHLIRTSILLVMYAIFEGMTESKYNSIGSFLSNDSHVFVAIVIPLLGLVVGFTNVIANRYLSMLQETAAQLKKYSEWLLGRDLLSAAITDANTLSLQRRERTVLFMDIRGFTSWSENKSPEVVVEMLNSYFEKAEQIWKASDVIKTKHTADEIMAVFPSEYGAIKAVVQLNQEISVFLKRFDLSAGIGIHQGYLVEGLIGSEDVKMYDVIGDTVNTAKRICDQAGGGEILISQEVYAKLETVVTAHEPRFLKAKGKSEPLKVFPVKGFKGL
ncbi:adenylate/guanylate cyclase domain-containing protein [bacterium]|nr:adenylate/guanylate cyclase domain-containing protein [bacterium]